MVFSVTKSITNTKTNSAEADTSAADLKKAYEAWLAKNPTWLEDNGFGGIQLQVISASKDYPELEFSNPGKARGFDHWHSSQASLAASPLADGTAKQIAAIISDPIESEFIPAKCMPIYWEEKISDPIDTFDSAGIKSGYKLVTTGAGYTSTDFYDLQGVRVSSEYQSVYGYSSQTVYENFISPEGEQQCRVTSTGGGNSDSWSSSELYDAKNNLLESSFKNSDGYNSTTKQTFEKSSEGVVTKITMTADGTGNGYVYQSYSEYDGSWNLLKSTYTDGSGYSSSTERTATTVNGEVVGFSVSSTGKGANGYWYTSLESFDTNSALRNSQYEDSSGFYSKRSTTEGMDELWGSVIIVNDESYYGATYQSTTKYTSDWRVISSSSTDTNGNSSQTVTVKVKDKEGNEIYLQTYSFTYSDGTKSEWQTEYNDQWDQLVDGKPVDRPYPLWKTPDIALGSDPETLPIVSKTSTDEFRNTMASTSDAVSSQAVTGVKGHKDKLIGSGGDDVFVVNDKDDRITSGREGASDSVMSGDFGLDLRSKKWTGIENAMLVGDENFQLIGNSGANILSGNGGDNRLNGSHGSDTLFGGGGKDMFIVSLSSSFDEIVDFVSGEDKIALSGRAFRPLFGKNKQLKDDVFGNKLVLDESTGVLWFDSDGSGSKQAVEIAVIGVSESIVAADFILV
jgi:Ca2+-binding RTX toxin-like protein